jgi:hypothetical protein
LRLRGTSRSALIITSNVIDLAKGLSLLFLEFAVVWAVFVNFAFDSGRDLYTPSSVAAAAIALFVWAPAVFVLGLLTSFDPATDLLEETYAP